MHDKQCFDDGPLHESQFASQAAQSFFEASAQVPAGQLVLHNDPLKKFPYLQLKQSFAVPPLQVSHYPVQS